MGALKMEMLATAEGSWESESSQFPILAVRRVFYQEEAQKCRFLVPRSINTSRSD